MRSTLTLVYPPISNQEADWLKKDPEVRSRLQGSDFYAIGMRDEAKFEFDWVDDQAKTEEIIETRRIPVSISTTGGLRDKFVLDADKLAHEAGIEAPDSINFVAGEKVIKIYDAEVDENTTEPFAWFTTEKLIWDRSCDAAGIEGLDSHREFGTYRLLYIGIAKAAIFSPHEAWQSKRRTLSSMLRRLLFPSSTLTTTACSTPVSPLQAAIPKAFVGVVTQTMALN